MALLFSTFKKEDFPEYKSWYDDAELNMRLGPMDDEWLEHVLTETDGRQYSVFKDKELVAVVGLKLPNAEHPEYYITDLAMKPSLRSKGIGTEVLQKLIELHPKENWKAFIDVRNPRAKTFFERNGWKCVSESPDEHGMLMLEFTDTNS